MPKCEICGNEYDKTFEVLMAGKSHVFDSFECAIYALAPTCTHCADAAGKSGLRDRV